MGKEAFIFSIRIAESEGKQRQQHDKLQCRCKERVLSVVTGKCLLSLGTPYM